MLCKRDCKYVAWQSGDEEEDQSRGLVEKKLQDSLCKRHAQGLLSLPECSRKRPRVTKSCLWFSKRVVVDGTLLETAKEACAQRRSKPVVRGEFFPVSEARWFHPLLGSGAWEAVFIPSLCALEESQEETKLLVYRQWLYLCLQVEVGFCAKLPTSLQGKSARTMGT